MAAIITVSFTVPAGYAPGDYARLHGNSGSGSIDWDTALTEEIFDLFPGGAGLYGFGHVPFGHHRSGHGQSVRSSGFGHGPFGHYPYGHGAVVIEASIAIISCGAYKFGFKGYDAAGNAHVGEPEEIDVPVHIAPAPPTGLKFNAYNKTTDVLTLDAA